MTQRERNWRSWGSCGGQRLRVTGLIAAAILAAAICGCPSTAPATGDAGNGGGDSTSPAVKGEQSVTTKAANRNRTYTLYAPASFQAGVAMPVVFAMHGTAGDGRSFLFDNDWDDAAEREGFIVVAPDALGLNPDAPINAITNTSIWSATQFSLGGATDNFDVLFFDNLLAELSTKLGFTVDRVFIAGHSSGGSMGFVLASERSENVAALGAVGSHWIGIGPAPEPATPTLFIVGTQDPLAPLTGGDGITPSIDFTLDRWSLALGCNLAPTEVSNTGGLLTESYDNCRDGVPFRVIYISGQGHAWPGGHGLNELVLGPDTELLFATDTIWAFFAENGAK